MYHPKQITRAEELVAGEEYAFILDGPTLDATLVAEVAFVGTVDSDDRLGDPDGRCGAGGDWAEEEAALRARTDRELRRRLGFG